MNFADPVKSTDTIMTFPCVAGGNEHRNFHELRNAYIDYLAEIEFEKESKENRTGKWHSLVKLMLTSWVDTKVHNNPSYQTYREALATLGDYQAQMRVKSRPTR